MCVVRVACAIYCRLPFAVAFKHSIAAAAVAAACVFIVDSLVAAEKELKHLVCAFDNLNLTESHVCDVRGRVE